MKKKAVFNEKDGTMVRRQLFLPRDQVAFLKELSKASDRSKAYFVREAIRWYADKKHGVKLAPEPEPGHYE